MASNLKLKNANNKILTLVNPDTVTIEARAFIRANK